MNPIDLYEAAAFYRSAALSGETVTGHEYGEAFDYWDDTQRGCLGLPGDLAMPPDTGQTAEDHAARKSLLVDIARRKIEKQLEEMAERIEQVRNMHGPIRDGGLCVVCLKRWPCPTLRVTFGSEMP